MNLKYNLYRIYQIVPHLSYNLVSNKYQVLISLFLGKSRIPLQINDSSIKFEFNTDQVPCMLNLLKIISFSKDYKIDSNGLLEISFDGKSVQS